MFASQMGRSPCPVLPVGSRNAGEWANSDIWGTPLKPPLVRCTQSFQSASRCLARKYKPLAKHHYIFKEGVQNKKALAKINIKQIEDSEHIQGAK